MKCIIIGGGPAGLTVGNVLKEKCGGDFLVLEKEQEAGGLCRSVEVERAPLDIGGGHFLDVRRPHVNTFLFKFMPEKEWSLFDRKTTIHVNGNVIGQPIEANIWQMKIEDQVEYLKAIAVAGCNIGTPKPEKFIDWIYWKLGKKIAEDYMIPYNQKMFGDNLNNLGTYWLEKLPDVSFEETLLSCLEKRPYGRDPGHTQFYYPNEYGYGELWIRMARNIESNIRYGTSVNKIDFDKHCVVTSDGEEFFGDTIIQTIPWVEFEELVGMPQELADKIRDLKYSSIAVDFFPDTLNTESQWIYYPDPKLSYHRILVRHNFCRDSCGYWTETNSDRLVDCNKHENSRYHYLNKYAYPLNTINKPLIMDELLGWCKKYNVIGLGRWGEHQHYNSDVTVEKALKLANTMIL